MIKVATQHQFSYEEAKSMYTNAPETEYCSQSHILYITCTRSFTGLLNLMYSSGLQSNLKHLIVVILYEQNILQKENLPAQFMWHRICTSL